MHPSTLINAILLCFLNTSIIVVGIILNSTVIISLWRSSQLRNKMCYFTIFVLSCFDLGVVVIVQPLLMLSTILWSMQMYSAQIQATRKYMSLFLLGLSMFALLTLNIERFLAITRPFFHQTAVTKGKLVLFLTLQMITGFSLLLPWLFYSKEKFHYSIFITVFILLFLFILAFLNYKMLVIVKSKRKDELRVVPARLETPGNEERQKKRKTNFKNISTCCLAVGCCFCCFFPETILGTWNYNLKFAKNDRQRILFNIWASTFACMNSTLNCVIFFWRNSFLRREGMKILKCLLRTGRS